MRIHVVVRSMLAILALSIAGVTSAAPAGRLVELTGNDQMKYNLATIPAKPGETLKASLVVSNPLTRPMKHTLTLEG